MSVFVVYVCVWERQRRRLVIVGRVTVRAGRQEGRQVATQTTVQSVHTLCLGAREPSNNKLNPS